MLLPAGEVLTYGTSLYRGEVPELATNPIHASADGELSEARCASIRATIDALTSTEGHSYTKRDQIVFAQGKEDADALRSLQDDLYLYCDDPLDSPYLRGLDLGSRLPGSIALAKGRVIGGDRAQIVDPRLAVLNFVSEATADEELAASLAASSSQREEQAASIVSTFEHSMRADGHEYGTEKMHSVPGTTGPVSARLSYVQSSEGKLNLVWSLEVPMDHDANSNLYQATVDATTAEVRSVVDWVQSAPAHAHRASEEDEGVAQEALYKVIRWGLNDPSEGNRTLEAGIHDYSASPYGWHSIPSSKKADKHFSDTRGNNVFASAFGSGMDDWEVPDRARPVGKKADNGSLIFDFPFPWRNANAQHDPLDPEKYADASTVELFYLINAYHDLLYLYGFTPAAGNFEEAEAEEGGKGGDAIAAYSQSSAGTNNADFTSPPDGSRPRVRMYKWHTKENATDRDGDFEQGIVLHEVTHGVSTRLTGGPADSSCLGWGEAGGMGEGWGDFFATIVRRKTPTRDIYTMGSWASHNKKGIRRYPYSTNLTINPETYKTLDSPGYWGVHAIGEVWAGMLYQVEEGLRAKLGWSPDLFPPTANATQKEQDEFFLGDDELDKLLGGKKRASQRRVPRHGNTLAFQLIIDGMKLQPCRPGFFEARDAIIKADEHLTGGANQCLIWERFAQRGLGTDAKVVGRTPWGGGIRTDGHAVPSKCKSKEA